MKKFYVYFVLFNILLIAIIHFLSGEKIYQYSWNKGSAYQVTAKSSIGGDNFSLISTLYVRPIIEDNETYLLMQFRPFDFAVNSIQTKDVNIMVDDELVVVKIENNGKFVESYFPKNFDNNTISFLTFLIDNLSLPIETTQDSYVVKTDKVDAKISREFWLSSLEFNDNNVNTIHLSITNVKLSNKMLIFRQQNIKELIEEYYGNR